VKLTFGGDADDSQSQSPTTKRLRLITDSVDWLDHLREQSAKSSTIPDCGEDRHWHPLRKLRLLFGNSDEELSQQVRHPSPTVDDDDDDDDDADSVVTSKSISSCETSESETKGVFDKDAMTQADQEAMKSYIPLNATALTYISDDNGDGSNILDFFLKPPNGGLGRTNCRKVPSSLRERWSPLSSLTNDTDIEGRTERVMSKTSPASVSCFVGSKSLVRKRCSDTDKVDRDDVHLVAAVTEPIVDRSAVPADGRVCDVSWNGCCPATSSDSAAKCGDEAAQRSCSQGSDDFRTPDSAGHSVVDVTSRSAGSQPLDSDSTVDVGCSPGTTRLRREAGASPPLQFASDATTTDGWCTPSKGSVPDTVSPRSLRTSGSYAGRPSKSLPSPCSTHRGVDLPDLSDGRRVPVACSVPDVPDIIGPQTPRVTESCACRRLAFGDRSVKSSCSKLSTTILPTHSPTDQIDQPRVITTAIFTTSGSDLQTVRHTPVTCFVPDCSRSNESPSATSSAAVAPPRRDASPASSKDSGQLAADCYDGDVDSESDDVIDLCVRVRRRRMRSRSTSVDAPLVVSSSSDSSDRSPPLLRSRDWPSKHGVDHVVLSSGGASDVQAGCNEADCKADDIVIRGSPVLFSESST